MTAQDDQAKARLDGYLGQIYGARHGLTPSGSFADFAKALQVDPDLRAAAEARLAELEGLAAAMNGNVGRRCVMSAAHLDALREVLKKS